MFDETHNSNTQIGSPANPNFSVDPNPMLNYTGHEDFAKSQASLSKLFVKPLWEKMAEMMPSLKKYTNRIDDNIK